MKNIFFFILFVLFVLSASSCKKAKNDSYFDNVNCNEPDDTLNTYSQKIGAIFNLNCTRSGCHDNGTHKGGVNLDGYDNCVSSFDKKKILCKKGKHNKCDYDAYNLD